MSEDNGSKIEKEESEEKERKMIDSSYNLDMEIDSEERKEENSSFQKFRPSSQNQMIEIEPTKIGGILVNPELKDDLFNQIIKNYREYELEKEKNITVVVQAEKVLKKQITKYGNYDTASENSKNFENLSDTNENKNYINLENNIVFNELKDRYNTNRFYNPLIEEIDDDMNYPKENNNLNINYMNDLWDKARKFNNKTYNTAMNFFVKEIYRKEDDEKKNKNNNMIQLGSDDEEISLQNTINQAKIGSSDINEYKMDLISDEVKYFMRDVYNKRKRTYRLTFDKEGQVIQDFIELNPKSIQRIIQLMGYSNNDINYFDLMSIIDEKEKFILNRISQKQKVNEQDEYTQNHIFNQRKCLNIPNAKYILSGFSNNNEITIPSKSMKKISQMINSDPEEVSVLDTIGFSIVYIEVKKSTSSIGSNDGKASKSADTLSKKNNDDNKVNIKVNYNYTNDDNQDNNYNNIRRGIYCFYFRKKEPIRIREKSANKIRELIGDEECVLDQINYSKMSTEDEIELRKKHLIPKRKIFINFENLNENQSLNVNLMGKIREIPSIIYIVSGNSFPKTIILKSKSFNKIYNMIPRKDNEVIVLDLIPIILNNNNDRKLITSKKNPIGKYNSISQIEEVEDEDESIEKKSLMSSEKKKK